MVRSLSRGFPAAALAAVALALPAAASAAAPTALTTAPTLSGQATATLRGSAFAGDESGATIHFDYALAGTPFCATGAGTPTSTQPKALAIEDSPRPVSQSISGLSPGQSYCAELVVVNATSGPAGVRGGRVDFVNLLVGVPDVATLPATEITSARATLNASVNPQGAATTARFEWGLASGTWCTSGGVNGSPSRTASEPAGDDTTTHAVAEALTNLKAEATYCFRATAQNARGTGVGSFQQFNAPAVSPAPAPAPAPGSGVAGTGAAGGATGATGATGPQLRGPFDYLTVPAALYDAKFKSVRFSVTVGNAGSKIEVRLRAKKGRKIITVGKFSDTIDAGVTRFTMGFNSAGKRLLKKKQHIALQLYVVVTPPKNVPMFRQAFFDFRRGVEPVPAATARRRSAR